MKFFRYSFWLLLIINISVLAQNHNDVLRLSEPGIDAGARALGMGNAYTALSNDFSGVQFNPAGIGLAKDPEITGSFNYNTMLNNSYLYDSRTTKEFSENKMKLNDFGAVFPLPTQRGSMVFAFGYTTVKNFNSGTRFNDFNDGDHSMIQSLLGYDDISYSLFLTDESGENTPIQGNLRQLGNTRESGKLGAWSISGAVEVAKNIFMGATINVFSGTYSYDRQYWEEDTGNNYISTVLTDPNDPETADFNKFYLNDIINWDIAGWEAKIGMMYVLSNESTIGLSIKFPSKYQLTENYFVDATSEFGTGLDVVLDPPIENLLEYDISTPFEFAVGHALNLGPFLLSADLKYIDYTQMEFDEGLSQADMSQIKRDIKDLFDGQISYNLGAEFEVPYASESLVFRAGYFNVPSPYKNDPSGYDKKYFTLGFGIGSDGPIALDFAYAHGWWEGIDDLYGSGEARLTNDVTVSNAVFSMTYRFW